MKNLFVLFIAALLVVSCTQRDNSDKPVADKWNGYEKYLKNGEKTKDLKDKNNNKVGVVKSGIDQDANFYVKYDCSTSGKELSKTNLYCGTKKDIPLNKPDEPREERFPNTKDHQDGECTYTYKIPLCELPHADTGFVYSSHCKIKDSDGHCEDAWADDEDKFHDNGCGGYDDDYIPPVTPPITVLYGTAYTNDSLKLYNLDITNGTTTLILREYVGNSAGRYDGAAYDVTTGIFLFANYNTGELWVNQLKDPDPSYSAGILAGTPASGTFNTNSYYYVSEGVNTINRVSFTSTWTISSEVILDTIPSTIVVNDIAMNPAGDVMYILGQVNGGTQELISWNVATETFYSMSIAVTSGAQITYGSDGVLYVIATIVEGGTHSLTYTVDTTTGVLTVIQDQIIIIEDPFSDITAGPTM
jgi:hypothetical protein